MAGIVQIYLLVILVGLLSLTELSSAAASRAELSSAFGSRYSRQAIRNRRSETSLDKVLIGLENLESMFFREQSKVEELQDKVDELQSALLLTSEQLKKMKSDSNGSSGLPCGQDVPTVVGSSRLHLCFHSNVVEGLRLEKLARQRLGKSFETMKTRQEQFLAKLANFDHKIMDLQTNVSQETLDVEVFKSKQESNQIKFRELDNDIADLSALVSTCNCETQNETRGNKRESCPSGFNELRTGCYFMSVITEGFYRLAKNECSQRNASILSVESEDEKVAILSYIQQNKAPWALTSGKRLFGETKWTEGENKGAIISPDVLDKWHGGIVSRGKYCLFYTSENTWFDYDCDQKSTFHYICEI